MTPSLNNARAETHPQKAEIMKCIQLKYEEVPLKFLEFDKAFVHEKELLDHCGPVSNYDPDTLWVTSYNSCIIHVFRLQSHKD